MGSRELQLKVQNMKCSGCVARAKEAVSKLDGYEGAEFDFKSGAGWVRGDVDPEAVIHALTKLGYPAARAE
jgi:copper chaperone CopZ